MKMVPKYPCRSCLYFDYCGSSTRTEFCGGRFTKSQKKAAEKLKAKREQDKANKTKISLGGIV